MVIETLLADQTRLSCSIHAYCLMPDHLHYLLSPQRDGCSVLAFTQQFKGKTTNQSWSLGWQGRLWQPRSYDHILRSDEDWKHVAEYIVMNPVRKGLVSDWAEWKWSGLFID